MGLLVCFLRLTKLDESIWDVRIEDLVSGLVVVPGDVFNDLQRELSKGWVGRVNLPPQVVQYLLLQKSLNMDAVLLRRNDHQTAERFVHQMEVTLSLLQYIYEYLEAVLIEQILRYGLLEFHAFPNHDDTLVDFQHFLAVQERDVEWKLAAVWLLAETLQDFTFQKFISIGVQMGEVEV